MELGKHQFLPVADEVRPHRTSNKNIDKIPSLDHCPIPKQPLAGKINITTHNPTQTGVDRYFLVTHSIVGFLFSETSLGSGSLAGPDPLSRNARRWRSSPCSATSNGCASFIPCPGQAPVKTAGSPAAERCWFAAGARRCGLRAAREACRCSCRL